MPTGKIIKLVHLSQQTNQPTSRLIPRHNDTGYGTIRDEDGHEVYFSHDAVPGRHGFDDLRRGQSVEYTLDSESNASAQLVDATNDPANCQIPTPDVDEGDETRFGHVARTFQRPTQPTAITYHPLDGYSRGK